MGTANSMHLVCEALGMTLPGSAPVAAGSPKMHANLRAAGARIVEMVWQDLKPRDVITAGAVRNAVQMVLAVSGSINCVKHLQAIASEAEVDIDVYQTFAEYAERVPLLAAVKPNGDKHIEDFEAAGGARAVLKRLEGQLDVSARSVSGHSLGEILAATTVPDDGTIAALDRPLSTRPAIVIVRGSLLPGGGIVRLGGTGERMLEFRGKANIFHSRDEALAAIKDGRVRAGDVVVLRGLGVIGGPGMAMTSAVIFALDGAGLLDKVAAITEGQLSGLVNNGLVVGEASPEAAAGGPLAYLDNGDTIAIDVRRKTVDLEVPDDVLAERRNTSRTFGAHDQRGWLGVYQRTVVPVHEGAILKGK
jgi:dihydroxy-acid dehydratase